MSTSCKLCHVSNNLYLLAECRLICQEATSSQVIHRQQPVDTNQLIVSQWLYYQRWRLSYSLYHTDRSSVTSCPMMSDNWTTASTNYNKRADNPTVHVAYFTQTNYTFTRKQLTYLSTFVSALNLLFAWVVGMVFELQTRSSATAEKQRVSCPHGGG